MANSPTPSDFSNPIDLSTAHDMVQLYLDKWADSTTQVNSLLVKADSLRDYLADTSIKYVKLMFAYEDKDHADNDQQTLVIVGVSETVNPDTQKVTRDFVYMPNTNSQVLNYCMPCPAFCGYASDNFPV